MTFTRIELTYKIFWRDFLSVKFNSIQLTISLLSVHIRNWINNKSQLNLIVDTKSFMSIINLNIVKKYKISDNFWFSLPLLYNKYKLCVQKKKFLFSSNYIFLNPPKYSILLIKTSAYPCTCKNLNFSSYCKYIFTHCKYNRYFVLIVY